MKIPPRLAPLLLALPSALLAACSDGDGGGGGDDRRLRMAIPPSAALSDLLPSPAAPVAPAFRPVTRFGLRAPLAAPPGVRPADGLTGYESTTALADDGEPGADIWRFAVGEDGLRAALGDAAVEAGKARLAAAYRPYVESAPLRAHIADLLAGHPTLAPLATALSLDVDGLEIESISLHDGLFADLDADGSHEQTRSALTLIVNLPAFAVPTPAAPFPACAGVIGDGTAPAELAAQSELAWVDPAAAAWRFRVRLVTHYALADLTAEHAARWTPTEYPSQGARDAAELDLAIFAGFLADPGAGLPGSDLTASVVPEETLAGSTLNLVSALARSANDAECLRQVDGWMTSVSLVQPELEEAQAAPERHLVQAYPAGLDASDGSTDPGLSCLHDQDGNPVAVDGEPACGTPSGPVELEPVPGTPTAMLVTPYVRMTTSLPSSAAFSVPGGEIASCTSEPWKSMCTGRFGRGIKLCLGEWALREQVGDYWNIRWWQDSGKAATQVAIKGGAYILRGVVYVYMGGGQTKFLMKLAALEEGSAYLADVATSFTGQKVAGQSIQLAALPLKKMLTAAYKNKGVVTKTPNVVAGFVVDKVIDGLAQMAEVQATGWQDYSPDSHCRCGFQYRDPNYCD